MAVQWLMLILTTFVLSSLITDVVSESGYYYHYTDKTSGDAIKNSGMIRKSNGSADAAYGPGVYLTSMSPQRYSASQIATNNWLNPASTQRTKRVFELKISSDVREVGQKRDIWLYTNGDLYLNKIDSWVYYDWESGEVGDVTVLASGNSPMLSDKIVQFLSVSLAIIISKRMF